MRLREFDNYISSFKNDISSLLQSRPLHVSGVQRLTTARLGRYWLSKQDDLKQYDHSSTSQKQYSSLLFGMVVSPEHRSPVLLHHVRPLSPRQCVLATRRYQVLHCLSSLSLRPKTSSLQHLTRSCYNHSRAGVGVSYRDGGSLPRTSLLSHLDNLLYSILELAEAADGRLVRRGERKESYEKSSNAYEKQAFAV